MIKRLVVGLVLGIVIGGALAAALVKGLGVTTFVAGGWALAYLAAAATGVVTGLVAGKPIWSADGKIEAGLKAFFGGLLAAGAMFALRSWVKVDVDLGALGAGAGPVGELPAVALPGIAALLAAFFELDNTGDGASDKETKVRVGTGARVAGAESAEDEEAPASGAKRRAR